MPIYEYMCPKCNLKFELRQSFSESPVALCPECHNGAQRLFAPVPIIFKGPGFYTTDNRKEPPKSDSTDDKEEKNNKNA